MDEQNKVDDLLGIQYGNVTTLKSNVRFLIVGGDDKHGNQGLVGSSFESSILSGVRSSKIDKSLFTINFRKKFKGFMEVQVSPVVKMGGAKYRDGFLFQTDKGMTLFLAKKTKMQLEAKLEKRRFGETIKNSNRQIPAGNDEYRDSLIQALPPGKRISRNGKIYYENRFNRSDMRNDDSWNKL